MLLIECRKIKKYFGDRLILAVDNLKIYSEDRIGIVGVNGVGKTTLINILGQRLDPDEGWVRSAVSSSFIAQLDETKSKVISTELAAKFGVVNAWEKTMSGGEKTRFKLAASLSENNPLIFADEPTSNLDLDGIELIEKCFAEYQGAIVIISHDRSFLDKLCNKIWELEAGKIKIYNGNYSDYLAQKAQEQARVQTEYEEYVKEKKRLETVVIATNEKAKSIRKAPKRMGNSEARLHKMGNQKAKKNLEQAAKRVEKRIDQLEVKQKPVQSEKIKLALLESAKLHSKIIIEAEGLNKNFGDKLIFRKVDFKIYNGSKIALIGPNGSGKTTLLKMILNQDDSIKIAQGAKVGYFSQDMSILDEKRSIIENVMETSIYPENFVRLLLARLLFKRDDVYKKVNVLSGGEQVKAAFAKILVQDINLLILDEPTNYLDINSLEVIEVALKEYERTVMLVSHDRSFINSVADQLMLIENHQIKMFEGNYDQFLAAKSKGRSADREELEKKIHILENRLSVVIGKLSMPLNREELSQLDQNYYTILAELKRLRSQL